MDIEKVRYFAESLALTDDPSAVNTVLVADDDPVFRHLLQTSLEKWSYEVIAVENGLEAWKILSESTAPRMAILDWMMPEMDGVTLCRKLRSNQNAHYCYLLLVTSKDEKQDVIVGLDAGADDYLTKPFDVDELRARIRAGSRIVHLQDALLRAKEKLQFEVAHDALTGLWNRPAILEIVQKETARHRRTASELGIIMAVVDHFKDINDTQGHLTGDAILREVAARLLAAVRSYDSAGRYGGEEFLIVVPGCCRQDLLAGAERIRAAIAGRSIACDACNVSVTVSLGVVSASSMKNLLSFESLLQAADAALYKAKSNGRNRVEEATEIAVNPA